MHLWFLTPLYRGASVAYCEGLRHIQKNMQQAKVSVFLAVPLILKLCIEKYGMVLKSKEKNKTC